MSRNNSDDFFGIEVDSIHYEKNAKNYKENNVSHNMESEQSIDKQKPSGTEFLEDALCPGLRERADRYERAAISDDINSLEHSIPADEAQAYLQRHQNQQESYLRQAMMMQDTSLPKNVATKEMSDEYNNQEDSFERGEQRAHRRQKRQIEPTQYSQTYADTPSGLSEIFSNFPDLRFSTEDDIVDMMVDQVVYCDNNLIAFNKPYGLSYSGNKNGQLQIDRLLQKIKAKVAPKVERLYLIKSNDKLNSGILLFGTSNAVKKDVAEMIESDMVDYKYRCIVRGALDDSPVDVTIPLVKVIKDGGLKLTPLVSNKVKYPIHYVTTEVRELASNSIVSHIEAVTKKDVPHQVRAHLSMVGCPVIGDNKYGGHADRSMKYPGEVLNRLNLTPNQSRKMPFFCHLKEMSLPPLVGSNPVLISAPIPFHFRWMLKRLRLLKI